MRTWGDTTPGSGTGTGTVAVQAALGATAPVDGALFVALLGGLRVHAGGEVLGARQLGGAKPRHILIALAVARGSAVSKDRLVSLLWGDEPPHGAMATLETYVSVLRKRLQPSRPSRHGVIRTLPGGYALDLTQVSLDLVDFETAVGRAMLAGTPTATTLEMLTQALALAAGPLLPDEPEVDWLDVERNRHERMVTAAMVEASAAARAQGAGREAVRWAQEAVDRDSLDESAWKALLESLQASGRHADGLRAYDRCRRLFADELGCSPGPLLQEVFRRLLRGANSADDELTALLDAVIELHGAARHAARSATLSQARSATELIEQAFRRLDDLLRDVVPVRVLRAPASV
ncbi:MAG: AfsR/SARP family transcriptional regulator [Oryzihumus sp.]